MAREEWTLPADLLASPGWHWLWERLLQPMPEDEAEQDFQAAEDGERQAGAENTGLPEAMERTASP
jgi:hypothetical protein